MEKERKHLRPFLILLMLGKDFPPGEALINGLKTSSPANYMEIKNQRQWTTAGTKRFLLENAWKMSYLQPVTAFFNTPESEFSKIIMVAIFKCRSYCPPPVGNGWTLADRELKIICMQSICISSIVLLMVPVYNNMQLAALEQSF